MKEWEIKKRMTSLLKHHLIFMTDILNKILMMVVREFSMPKC